MARIKPIERSNAPHDVEELFKQMDALGKPPPNAHLTYAQSPSMYKTWFPFATYLMPNSIVDPRYRQIVILRTAYIWKSGYLWAQHADVSARLSLLSEEDIASLSEDNLSHWSPEEDSLIKACDETKAHGAILEGTWSALAAFLDDSELVELTFLIGQYILIATTVSSLDIDLDDGMDLPVWSLNAFR